MLYLARWCRGPGWWDSLARSGISLMLSTAPTCSRHTSMARPTSSRGPWYRPSSLVLWGATCNTSSWHVHHCRTLFISIEDVFLTGLCASKDLELRLSHRNVGVKCQIRYVLFDTFNCFSRIFSDWQKGLKHIRLCVKLIILWLYIVLNRCWWRVCGTKIKY